MLTDIIPASARKVVYAIYALIGVIFGAWSAFAGASDTYAMPSWYAGAVAAFAFIGTALGATAASNTVETGKHAA